MNTSGGVPDMGFDAWSRSFREAMAVLTSSAPAGAGMMPGLSGWPNMSAWSGAGAMPGMGAIPGMGAMPVMGAMSGMGAIPGLGSGFSGVFPGQAAAGPFMAMFEQLSAAAQAQWQQLASRFAAGAGGAEDGLAAWRQLLTSMAPAAGANPMSMPGMDTSSLREVLSTPQVGPMREHVERWQQAMLAQLDYQEASRAFTAQLGEISKLTLERFAQRVAARAEPGKQIASMRELFDEWIEAGEAVWAERANDDAFSAALGQYTNAQMRMRAAQADQINRIAQSMGLPTRGEVDSDHRRVAQLERDLRRVQHELEALREAAVASAPSESAQKKSGGSAATAVAATQVAARKKSVASKKSAAPKKASATKQAGAPKKTAASKKIVTSKARAKPAAKIAEPASVADKKPRTSAAAVKRSTPSKPRRSKVSAFSLVTAPRAIGKAARKSAGKAASSKRTAT